MSRSMTMSKIVFVLSSLLIAMASTASAQTRYSTNIQSTPPGATVFLDATTGTPLGVTPLTRVRIARGQHNFIFRLEGYQETTVAVDVRRSGTTVTGALQQLARVQISAGDASAQGATVTIDGNAVGTIPYSGFLRPDRVQIVISRDGFVSSDQWVTLTAGQVFAWPVTLRPNAPRMGSLSVFSDQRGVPVFIDGTQRCTTPCTLGEVPEGPHLVEVRPADGSRPHTQQVTITAGQAASVDAQLVSGGTLRVISRTAGAEVLVDGDVVGPTPAVREGLSAGEHIVEVRAPNFETAHQTVTITSGQQRVVSIDLTPTAATTGSIRVVGTPRGATVSVDGTPIGELPTEATGLTAGDHIVEVTMAGYTASTQTVSVTAGQQRLVSIALLENRAPGRIVIRASTPGAIAIIDGGTPVQLPYALDNAPVGTHAIIVRAPGVTEYSTTCVVGPGQDCDVNAQLQGATVRFRIATQSGVSGAMLYVDNGEIGPVPYDGQIAAGSHRIEVRAPDYRTYSEWVTIDETQPPPVMEILLTHVNDLTPEEIAERELAREREMRGAFGTSAATLPADLATVEIRGGWPYLADVRFNMGVHPNVDIGLGARNAGRLTEFTMIGRGGYRVNRRLSVGGALQLGGGVGPRRSEDGVEHKTSSFVLQADARASFHATRIAVFTLNVGIEYASDRYDYEIGNSDMLLPSTSWDRQNSARGRFGAIFEVALGTHDSLLFQALAIVGTPRRVLGDMFGIDGITYEDTNIGVHSNLQIGWVHKFNWRVDPDL